MTSETIADGLPLVPGTQTRQYHANAASIYALPADGKEYDRLEKQHQLMMHLFAGPVVAPIHTQLQNDNFQVLDVGCGPGSWIKEVQKAYPQAECHATDFAATYKTEDQDKVSFVIGDVLKGLPYADGHFDFVHIRCFTGALKAIEWPQAVAELFRITKPGGWVQMTEPDGQIRSLKGITPTIQDWNDRGMRGSLKKRGGEPLAGLKLKDYLTEGGFTRVEEKTVSAPMSEDQGALGALMVHDYHELVKTLAPVLSQSWSITSEEMVQWGEKVLAESRLLGGFHNFVTAFGQKGL